MGINWRQLLLVVLVAAIVGGASGFVGDQVSARWFDESTLGSPRVIPFIPGFREREDDRRRIENEIYELEERMKRRMDCFWNAQAEGLTYFQCPP
jgi:hypothetical protein